MSRYARPGNGVITILGVPLITAVVLPGGAVHALSWAMEPGVDEPGHLLWQHAAGAATVQGRPVLVRVGRTNGHVDVYAVTETGTRNPHRLAPHTPTPGGIPDPRWSEQPPDPDGLLEQVFAAERAGDIEAAMRAAGRLVSRLTLDLGQVHPWPWLAAELYADLTLLAGYWDRAVNLYCRVAIGRYSLRSPAAPALRCLRLATLAWVRASDRPTAAPVGLALAHTLITYLPDRTELLSLVLRRLPETLLPMTDMWDAPTPRTNPRHRPAGPGPDGSSPPPAHTPKEPTP